MDGWMLLQKNTASVCTDGCFAFDCRIHYEVIQKSADSCRAMSEKETSAVLQDMQDVCW